MQLALLGGSPVREKPLPAWPVYGKEEREQPSFFRSISRRLRPVRVDETGLATTRISDEAKLLIAGGTLRRLLGMGAQ